MPPQKASWLYSFFGLPYIQFRRKNGWKDLFLVITHSELEYFFFRPEILSFQFWIQLRKRSPHAIFYSLSADLSSVIHETPNAFVVKRPKQLAYIKDEVWWRCSESMIFIINECFQRVCPKFKFISIYFCFKRAFRSEIFYSIPSQKIFTDLMTNFTKFELSTIFRSWELTD